MKNQEPLRILEKEIPKVFVRRVAVALSVSSALALTLAVAWTTLQKSAIESQTRESLAAAISEPIRAHDLISMTRIIKAFELANPSAEICVRLIDDVAVTTHNCNEWDFSTFSVALTGEKYRVAVSSPLPSLPLIAGVLLFMASALILLAAQFSARRFTALLLEDLRILAQPNAPELPTFAEFREARVKIDQVQGQQAMIALGAQVSHDIRSPLSALNMVIGTLRDLPEEKRLIIRNAVQRINDIANGLLQKGKKASATIVDAANSKHQTSQPEPVLLMALIDSIVSEKRMQFREKMSIEIQGDLSSGYGVFANIDATELSRVISNLVNNSVEALPDAGTVTIKMTADAQNARITVGDNGIGMDADLIARLGERGLSHGKEKSESGSGLGLYHARQAIGKARGTIEIKSLPGLGTEVSLTLPRAAAPNWFTDSIVLQNGAELVSVDDDQTIHQIWEERLSADALSNIKHKTFSSLDQFESWMGQENRDLKMFVIDYEFLGQKRNGLDLIETLGIGRQSILVTSHYEESDLQARAIRLGVKILPKALAPCVPIVGPKRPAASTKPRSRRTDLSRTDRAQAESV